MLGVGSSKVYTDILILYTLRALTILPPASLGAELNNCKKCFL